VTTIIGYVAATLAALAFLPQVLKGLRTRSTGDLSVAMLASQASGVALWIVYGVAIRARPVIVANVVTLALTMTLLVLRWRHARPRSAVAPQ
jgi:MtN3 and saliva related transmembrane protein